MTFVWVHGTDARWHLFADTEAGLPVCRDAAPPWPDWQRWPGAGLPPEAARHRACQVYAAVSWRAEQEGVA